MNKFLLPCLALFLAAGAAQAQTTYKCVDARGKVTYTTTPCEDAGQKGEVVKNRMNSAPAQQVRVPQDPSQGGTRDGGSKDHAPAKQAAGDKPNIAPERRCFTTKSGTRCNDDPGTPDPTPQDERSKSETRAN